MTADDRDGVEVTASPTPSRPDPSLTEKTPRRGKPAGDVSLATERDYQRTIIELAKMLGWRVHHSRPAWTKHGWRTPIQGHSGFPDLVLAHELVGVMFIELKYSTKLTADQARWGDVLTLAGADWRELRVPDGLDTFCQYLTDITQAARR